MRQRLLLVLATAAWLITSLASGAAGARGRPAAPISASVGSAASRRALPANFLGLALEYSTLTRWMPTAAPKAPSYAAPVDPALVALIRGLDPSGSPLVRFGGLSTDRTWWPVPGMVKPAGITFALTSAWVNAARSLSLATGAHYLLGINLLADSTRLSAYEAASLLALLGRPEVAGWQLGNEPSLYPFLAWYRRSGRQILPWYATAGTPVYARPASYGPKQYLSELKRFLPVLPKGVPLSGPEGSGPAYMAVATGLLGHSGMDMLTSHAYGTDACVTNPSSPQFPSPAHQLSRVASRGLLAGLSRYVAIAHAHGATYRVDEMGPASCNGARGISDTMVGALWELDSLFALAASGVDGVNLHTFPSNLNALFDISGHGSVWSATAHPLYYAALLFEQATGAGARLLPTSLTAHSPLRAWAVLAAGRQRRVVLLNDSNVAHTVRLRVAGASGAARLEALEGSGGLGARTVTLGGVPVASNGVWSQPSTLPTVTPLSGAYTVTLAPGSAALLTFG